MLNVRSFNRLLLTSFKIYSENVMRVEIAVTFSLRRLSIIRHLTYCCDDSSISGRWQLMWQTVFVQCNLSEARYMTTRAGIPEWNSLICDFVCTSYIWPSLEKCACI